VNSTSLSLSESTVLQVLIYFEIFNYPLTLDEIHRYCQSKMSLAEVRNIIMELVSAEKVFDLGGFYSLSDDDLTKRERLIANKMAEKSMSKARENGYRIARFPFVRCVCISGSLSKNVMTEGGDIDYFIISKGGRMWVSKLLLILYKKFFLRNSSEFFCLNYFISDKDLEIPEKNLFTSIEIATLIPVVNPKLYRDFVSANNWMKDHLPNVWQEDSSHSNISQLQGKTGVSRLIEVVLRGKLGEKIDDLVLSIYRTRNKLRYAKVNDNSFELMFRSTKTQSKIHASNHQNVIMAKFEDACKIRNITNAKS